VVREEGPKDAEPLPREAAASEPESAREIIAEAEPSFFGDPKRLVQTGIAVVLLTVAIYVLLPKIVGLDDTLSKIEDGDPLWIAVAIGFTVAAFGAYVALFKGVVGEKVIHLTVGESYQITMAGLAATRLFSAGGAGGILLTYWALRKAGMERRRAVCRMLAFLIIQYSIYLLALIVFGILLREGVLPGEAPFGMTIVPAIVAGVLLTIMLLMAFVPEDLERRIVKITSEGRVGRFARRAASAPATFAQATRTAIAFVRQGTQGVLAYAGAIGYWAAQIGILWASFQAFDVHVPFGVVVQGFFVGMIANLFPLAPGGVGAVDAGMIGAFVLFGLPEEEVFVAVLAYRVIGFWLPIPPGIFAFFQLRKTVARWEAEGREAPEQVEASERRAEEAEAAPA
jgi:uncharacterized protein (TIRG00374 family)